MNILMIKLSAIGDVIHTLPALAALRKKFPVKTPYFDTAVKREKLALLMKMFEARDGKGEEAFGDLSFAII